MTNLDQKWPRMNELINLKTFPSANIDQTHSWETGARTGRLCFADARPAEERAADPGSAVDPQQQFVVHDVHQTPDR